MKKHYLTITDQKYRVEVNMNTAEHWEKLAGKKIGQFETEAALSATTGGVPTRAMLLWLFCALVEGEDLEGREFPYSFEELKKIIKPSILSTFAPIFISCYIGDQSNDKEEKLSSQEEEKKKAKTWGFLSFVRSPLARWVGLLLIFGVLILMMFFWR